MPKRTKPTPRPPLQGPTTSPTFQRSIRTAQQPGAQPTAMMKALGAIIPEMGLMAAAMRPNMAKRKERGR